MVNSVLSFFRGKSILKGSKNARVLEVLLRFEEGLEGQDSLKAELLSATSNKGNRIKMYSLHLNQEEVPFDDVLHVTCTPKGWSSAECGEEFSVCCRLRNIRVIAKATVVLQGTERLLVDCG